MKCIKYTVVSLLVLFFVTLPLTLSKALPGMPGGETGKERKLTVEEQKMLELWEEYAAPGKNHKHLEYFVGDWESIQQVWEEPGAEPIFKKQEITVKSILGGRYVKAHIKSKDGFLGKPAETIVITGYNNYKKEFAAISFDNMSTNIYITRGTLDKTGKTRTETGHWDNIFTGKKFKVRAVTTIIHRDKYVYEFYQPDAEGNEFKCMEIIYTRKTGMINKQ